MPDESTELLSDEARRASYARFESSIRRQQKRRVRRFQCCVCTIFISVVTTIIVAIVSYTINVYAKMENNKSTNDTSTNSSALTVLSIKYPLYPFLPNASVVNANDESYRASIMMGIQSLQEQLTHWPELVKDSASYKHQLVMPTSRKAVFLSQLGYVEEVATKHYFTKHNISNQGRLCPTMITDDLFSATCTYPTLPCNNKPYRTYDGSCNNLVHPMEYGVANRPFIRLLQPSYADGIAAPRGASTKAAQLPSARTVSIAVHRPFYREDTKFTVMLAVWGQFLDHDITATALTKQLNHGQTISCCGTIVTHPDCFPVYLDDLDPYYTRYNVTCMEFVRSAPAPTCCLGARQQLNQASSFIDGSVIYGVDTDKVRSLRTLQSGLLKAYVTEDNRTLLPMSESEDDGCNREEEKAKGRYCFSTGDGRANENLHLTAMHLLWMRHHNNLAARLFKINPGWDDETLFQEVRRIIAAQMQHITYTEFLPIILGDTVKKFDLLPKSTGFYQQYDRNIDASAANSFAAAVFRFAHTLLPSLFKLLAHENDTVEYVQLHRILFDPYKLYLPGEMDRALRGAMRTAIEASDPYFTSEVQTRLFEDSTIEADATVLKTTAPCGLDLVALNIQRGRDHGLPGYRRWRQLCGLSVDEKTLRDDIDSESLRRITAIYNNNWADVDLYSGALSERPLAGSLLGPTFTCLILDQFVRLKRGDRFWYENGPARPAFTAKQLDSIRTTTLAGIICQNADDVQRVQRAVMKRASSLNRRIDCSQIQQLNLEHWNDYLPHVPITNERV